MVIHKNLTGHKNDQARVEQKNWSVVRQFVGVDRYKGANALRRPDDLDQALRLHANYFRPVLKQVNTQWVGGKLRKRHDRAKTPYERVRECEELSEQSKQRL